jgi:hypothetical protein
VWKAFKSTNGPLDDTTETYLNLTSTYFWPDVFRDIRHHQQTNQEHLDPEIASNNMETSKPGSKETDERIHADIFGPVTSANNKTHLVLSLTDEFTSYAVITAIQNKDATTIVEAVIKSWFQKFGFPKQLHINGGQILVTNQNLRHNPKKPPTSTEHAHQQVRPNQDLSTTAFNSSQHLSPTLPTFHVKT